MTTEYDLSRLPDLLARLDKTLPSSGLPFTDSWQAERRESAAAIRALMAENSILIAAHDAQAFDIANAIAAERESSPATATISPDAVEEAATELFAKYDEISDNTDWEELGNNTQNEYRDVARGIIGTAVAAEREACAKVCEEVASGAVPVPRSDYWGGGFWAGARECAAKIRARGAA